MAAAHSTNPFQSSKVWDRVGAEPTVAGGCNVDHAIGEDEDEATVEIGKFHYGSPG